MVTKEATALEKREAQAPRGIERISPSKVFVPYADIYETNDSIVVVADMPGVDEKSVDVTLEKSVLTITGTIQEQMPAGYTLAYAEYEVGNYQRSFTLSDQVNREGITAVIKNGVLRLTLQKSAEAKSRKIQVKAA
jgi:HSP20 family protein